MKRKYYAGIGDKKLPPQLPQIIQKVARGLQEEGYCLRNNGMDGAEREFMKGVSDKQLILPWNSFNGLKSQYNTAPEAALQIAYNHINLYGDMSHSKQEIMLAKIQTVLGVDCKTPVDMVVCYSFDELYGESAQMVSLAKAYQIEIVNLSKMNQYQLKEVFG